MSDLILPRAFAQQLGAYLVQQRYIDVADLIDALRRLRPAPPEPPEPEAPAP